MNNIAIQVLNYIFAFSMPFTHIGGYVASGIGVFFAWKYRKLLRTEPLFMFISLFIAYGIVRSVFSNDPYTGLGAMTGYFSHWLLPLILGAILQNPPSSRRAFWVLYWTFSFLIVVSLLAYFGLFYKQMGSFYLIEDNLLKALRSHISLAALCLLFSFFSISFALHNESRKPFYYFASLFFLAALALTGSRGYYIAAALSYSAFVLYWFARTKRWFSLGAVTAGAVLFMALLYSFSPVVRERIHRTGLNDQNVDERLSLYKVALREIKENPVFGFGPGQGIKQSAFFASLPENERNVSRHPHLHSFYLNLGADFGITGLALFGLIVYFWITVLWKSYAKAGGFTKALAFGLFWGLSGLLVGDCFDTLLRGPGIAMEFFWLTGLVLSRRAL